MEDWQQNVIAEKEQLDERIAKMAYFVRNDGKDMVGDEDLWLLRRQLDAMRDYSMVLNMRINEF